MSKKSTYTYTTLRYVHDVTTGEFVNVGIAMFAPELGYASAKCRKTITRVKNTFPGLNAEAFKASMKYVESKFKEVQDELTQLKGQLLLTGNRKTALEIALSAIGKDDSSLQWSPMGSGSTNDPEVTLERLYKRMVAANDEVTASSHRQDGDVWRKFSSALQNRKLLDHFKPKIISVMDDEIKFDHAWKNGVWHCLAPVSFDLSSPASIKDKAHKWLGQLSSVSDTKDKFKVYFLVGEPSQSDLTDAAQSAVNILKKSDMTGVVFTEHETERLAELIEQEVKAHEATLPT
jgi:Protein of unknown function (DUF3037)